MSLVATLARTGAVSAVHLARITGRPLESVYAELVHAEAQGRVRIVADGQWCKRAWEAMVPDDELPPPLRGGALEVF